MLARIILVAENSAGNITVRTRAYTPDGMHDIASAWEEFAERRWTCRVFISVDEMEAVGE